MLAGALGAGARLAGPAQLPSTLSPRYDMLVERTGDSSFGPDGKPVT